MIILFLFNVLCVEPITWIPPHKSHSQHISALIHRITAINHGIFCVVLCRIVLLVGYLGIHKATLLLSPSSLKVLNEYFHNVCELDLVFNFYKV